MKYRRLTPDELQELEQEFIRFLASNGIPAHDWEVLKANNKERVEQLIDDFSDMVYERVLGGVTLLERRERKSLQLFKFMDSKISMLGLLVQGASKLDFSQPLSPEDIAAHLQSADTSLQVMKGEKEYRQSREMEIFELLEAGCLIQKDDRLYTTLEELTGKLQASSNSVS